jgi:hypothetical protein
LQRPKEAAYDYGRCSSSLRADSGIRTKFTLVSEHWGGCSKPHVKRYYITVGTLDEDEAVGAVCVLHRTEIPS